MHTANKYVETFATSLVITNTQIKSTYFFQCNKLAVRIFLQKDVCVHVSAHECMTDNRNIWEVDVWVIFIFTMDMYTRNTVFCF